MQTNTPRKVSTQTNDAQKSLHTLTSLSQLADTMIGLALFGENRTQDTQPVWLSSLIVYLQTPRVFQSLIVLSLEPDTICLLSAENATLKTSWVCPTKRRVVLQLDRERTS